MSSLPRRLQLVGLSCLVLSLSPALASAGPGPCTVPPSYGDPVPVTLWTTSGSIEFELWPDVAPCTVLNFLDYAEAGDYDGSLVHRSVPGFVIQAGGYAYEPSTDAFVSIPRNPAVVNEPGESNLRGTIAMARIGGSINSATSEFFVNLADNLGLDTVDEGFTVFGEVVAADMAVVDEIAALPTLVGRWSLNSSLREIFSDLPVYALPLDATGGYGCFDPNASPALGQTGWTRALVNTAGNALEPDPLTDAIYYLSATCTGAGVIELPSVACATSREVAYSNGLSWLLDPAPMSCAAIAESEISLAARRDDHQPQVTPEQVEIIAIAVPEPVGIAPLAAALLGMTALARRCPTG